jgi:hypothetical protein
MTQQQYFKRLKEEMFKVMEMGTAFQTSSYKALMQEFRAAKSFGSLFDVFVNRYGAEVEDVRNVCIRAAVDEHINSMWEDIP